jgi:uncharacterized membrane protein YphA (DoxX/SURF4 family)
MWKMQRLYGTFPSRGAGVALLLLRFTIAGALLAQAWVCLPPGTDWIVAVYVLAACLLVAGLFTPMVAVATAALSAGTIMLCKEPAVSGLMIAILVALALLGAGSYSVDAKLYGRRRLVIRRAGETNTVPQDSDI